jgi:hypothetical protein
MVRCPWDRLYPHADPRTIVPVNLKDEDAFHLTIEEYLLALISLVEELVSFSILLYIPDG